jgi:hypothetical protein
LALQVKKKDFINWKCLTVTYKVVYK